MLCCLSRNVEGHMEFLPASERVEITRLAGTSLIRPGEMLPRTRTGGSWRRCLCRERDVGFAHLPGSLGQPGMSTEQPARLPGCLLAPRLPEHACLFPSCLHSLLDL